MNLANLLLRGSQNLGLLNVSTDILNLHREQA